MAERLLQAGLDQVVPGGFQVSSAGTRALVGEPMQPISADIVRTFPVRVLLGMAFTFGPAEPAGQPTLCSALGPSRDGLSLLTAGLYL